MSSTPRSAVSGPKDDPHLARLKYVLRGVQDRKELRERAMRFKKPLTSQQLVALLKVYPGSCTWQAKFLFEHFAPTLSDKQKTYKKLVQKLKPMIYFYDLDEPYEAWAVRILDVVDESPPIDDAPVAPLDPEVRVSPSPPATDAAPPVHARIPAGAIPDLAPDLYSGLVLSESALEVAGFETTCTFPRRLHARAYRTFEHAGITNFMEDKRDGLRQAQYAGWDPQMATSILKRLGSLVVAAIKAAPGPGPEKADCFLLLGLIIVEINDYLEKHEAEAASEAEAPGVRCQEALWNKLKSEGWTWKSGAGPDWYVRPGVWERIPGLERNVDYFSMEELCEYADAHGLWPTRETAAVSAPAGFYTTAPGGN